MHVNRMLSIHVEIMRMSHTTARAPMNFGPLQHVVEPASSDILFHLRRIRFSAASAEILDSKTMCGWWSVDSAHHIYETNTNNDRLSAEKIELSSTRLAVFTPVRVFPGSTRQLEP
ncbi:hypothetical protein Y032_0007g3468 [Ancylostoma ceylanicum]|uniref:Uncharacterized protein n=1 Tax=Ancylostoma ceylanicum TaxID=53326 RepID=A0A016VN76_9BILA|nr:hypothetical protein Y032_0007g3468 [Ancylostoma ceylanicum]